METQIAPTLVGLTFAALVSIALYVWLLVIGTGKIFSSVSFRSEKRWGYVAIFTGIWIVAVCLGLLAGFVWALLFGNVSIGLAILIVYMVASLTAVFYASIKDPRHKKVPS
jgi:hypothetical protein